ncbi:MAG: hypothetical protein SVR94_14955 [Pseudomonadota bacterium]|nr:hypothetical protein [Pseudomonadota bacterium]
MSSKVFKDNVFPRHVSDLMGLMHMVVFNGTDGEEQWPTYLSLEQKECVALGLALYYQCGHCIDHHNKMLSRMSRTDQDAFFSNMNSIVLFLRTDTASITPSEKNRWIQAWHSFSIRVSMKSGDKVMPYLIGLAIGMARDDDFLIQFCGGEIKNFFAAQSIDAKAAIGELESVVIFMKAAASKNRVAHKIDALFI